MDVEIVTYIAYTAEQTCFAAGEKSLEIYFVACLFKFLLLMLESFYY